MSSFPYIYDRKLAKSLRSKLSKYISIKIAKYSFMSKINEEIKDGEVICLVSYDLKYKKYSCITRTFSFRELYYEAFFIFIHWIHTLFYNTEFCDKIKKWTKLTYGEHKVSIWNTEMELLIMDIAECIDKKYGYRKILDYINLREYFHIFKCESSTANMIKQFRFTKIIVNGTEYIFKYNDDCTITINASIN